MFFTGYDVGAVKVDHAVTPLSISVHLKAGSTSVLACVLYE